MSGRLRRRRPQFATIPRQLLRDPQISRDAKAVYCLLDDYSNGPEDAPFPGQKLMAEQLGATDRAVRNWLNELARFGWITVEPHPGSSNSYWLEWEPVTPERGFRTPRNGGSAHPGTGVPPKENQGRRTREEPPPAPSEEGETIGADEGADGGQLFDPGQGRGTKTQRRKRRATTDIPPIVQAGFDRWWKRYPKGGGSKAKALAAMGKAVVDRDESMATLDRRLDNYLAARRLYAERFGAEPPTLHATTFINSRGPDFDDAWTLDDCRFWPPPDGRKWDDDADRRTQSQRDAAATIAGIRARSTIRR